MTRMYNRMSQIGMTDSGMILIGPSRSGVDHPAPEMFHIPISKTFNTQLSISSVYNLWMQLIRIPYGTDYPIS